MIVNPVPRAVLAVVTALALASGCGGGDEQASPTPAPTPTASSTQTPTPTPTAVPVVSDVAAYFVKDEKMAAARRAASGTAVAQAAVRGLLLGPTVDERAAGMSTAVPAGTTLLSLDIAGGVAVVDLNGRFASGGGSFSMGARMAQLVTTLTQFPSVAKVRLWLDGKPAQTLGGEGLIVDHPIGRADLEEWLPAILVDSPAAGAAITSPVRVRGSANVFEAVLFVEVTDGDGRIVATQRVMASSGTGTRGTFEVTVSFRAVRAGHGEIIAFSRSPRDGSRINIVETPVLVSL